jgi:hypothetical protein
VGRLRHRGQLVDDTRRRRSARDHFHPARLHRPRRGAQPGVRLTPGQSPARSDRREPADRVELRLVGSQAQRPSCASQRDRP